MQSLTKSREIIGILGPYVGKSVAETVLDAAVSKSKVDLTTLRETDDRVRLFFELQKRVRLYVRTPKRQQCCDELRLAIVGMSSKIEYKDYSLDVEGEADILWARSKARSVCSALGFREAMQLRVATVVSEITRNIVQHAGDGKIEIRVIEKQGTQGIQVTASDNGPGIGNLAEILAGNYRSRSGMGMGLRAAQRIMDAFDVTTSPQGGTVVRVEKYVRPLE